MNSPANFSLKVCTFGHIAICQNFLFRLKMTKTCEKLTLKKIGLTFMNLWISRLKSVLILYILWCILQSARAFSFFSMWKNDQNLWKALSSIDRPKACKFVHFQTKLSVNFSLWGQTVFIRPNAWYKQATCLIDLLKTEMNRAVFKLWTWLRYFKN